MPMYCTQGQHLQTETSGRKCTNAGGVRQARSPGQEGQHAMQRTTVHERDLVPQRSVPSATTSCTRVLDATAEHAPRRGTPPRRAAP
jgi:hypothetical protein